MILKYSLAGVFVRSLGVLSMLWGTVLPLLDLITPLCLFCLLVCWESRSSKDWCNDGLLWLLFPLCIWQVMKVFIITFWLEESSFSLSSLSFLLFSLSLCFFVYSFFFLSISLCLHGLLVRCSHGFLELVFTKLVQTYYICIDLTYSCLWYLLLISRLSFLGLRIICGARPASKVWRASGQDPVSICAYFLHVMLVPLEVVTYVFKHQELLYSNNKITSMYKYSSVCLFFASGRQRLIYEVLPIDAEQCVNSFDVRSTSVWRFEWFDY